LLIVFHSLCTNKIHYRFNACSNFDNIISLSLKARSTNGDDSFCDWFVFMNSLKKLFASECIFNKDSMINSAIKIKIFSCHISHNFKICEWIQIWENFNIKIFEIV